MWALRVVDGALLAREGALTQRFRARDGSLLAVVQVGRLSAPVPVVLLHGLGATGDYWTGTARRLARGGRTVLILDAPGSGASEAPRSPDGYSIDARAAAVSSLVSALGLEKVDLVGHSLGGWTAGLYAIAEPHHVRRLVLVDSAGFFQPSAEEAEALRRTLATTTPDEAPRLAKLLFERPPFPRAGFLLAALARAYRQPNVGETVARLSEKRLFTGREPSLPHGTVLIWGERDAFLPLADARAAAARIPGARLLVVTGVGHDGPIEAPAVFQQALERALSPARHLADSRGPAA